MSYSDLSDSDKQRLGAAFFNIKDQKSAMSKDNVCASVEILDLKFCIPGTNSSPRLTGTAPPQTSRSTDEKSPQPHSKPASPE